MQALGTSIQGLCLRSAKDSGKCLCFGQLQHVYKMRDIRSVLMGMIRLTVLNTEHAPDFVAFSSVIRISSWPQANVMSTIVLTGAYLV